MVPSKLVETDTSINPSRILALGQVPVESIYIHVPFCRAKCHYCDFYSLASCNSAEMMSDFVTALLSEAKWWRPYLGQQPPVSTLFFGGGTPSALPLDDMRRLIEGLRSSFQIEPDAEWTIEANPATIDLDYCRMLLDAGVNRLSIGAQSMIDSELRMLGRIHDAKEVGRTFRDAQEAGFKRLSIDLMYAVPYQTISSWQRTLEGALALGITHVSCYCLTLEEGTPMWAKTRAGELPTVGEEAQLEFMQFTRQWLGDHGLLPYEISNYATPGQECRHNLVYWKSGNYLGLGPASASHLSGLRWRDTPDVRRYVAAVLNEAHVPITDVEDLDAEHRATELVMLMLRCSTGLSWKRFSEIAGFDGRTVMSLAIARLKDLGLVTTSEDAMQLTEAGCYVADEVIGDLVRQLS